MRKKKKTMALVDLAAVRNGNNHHDFYSFSKNLRLEADEVRTFTKIPKESRGEKDVWGLIRVATNSGLLPTLFPYDPDSIISREIRNTLERKDIGKIILVGGDQAYSEDLWDLKRAKMPIKVILPSDNHSHLLKDVAEEITTIEKYANKYKPENAPILGGEKEKKGFREVVEGKGDDSMINSGKFGKVEAENGE